MFVNNCYSIGLLGKEENLQVCSFVRALVLDLICFALISLSNTLTADETLTGSPRWQSLWRVCQVSELSLLEDPSHDSTRWPLYWRPLADRQTVFAV